MQSRLGDLRALGAELVAITQSQPAALAETLRRVPRPFPFLCDPDRQVYRAFGLTRGGLGMFFRPRVLAHYLRQMLAGYPPQRPRPGEDVFQLGGDFVLDVHGRLVLSHPSSNPSDRPSVKDLLRAVRELSRPETTPSG